MSVDLKQERAQRAMTLSRPREGVRFAVLGAVRAWHRAGELDLGSPQQRAVLTAMLLREGRPVAVNQLVDAVWGEAAPLGAVSTVRTYVSRLRRVLEPDRVVGQPPDTVLSVSGGYAVRVPRSAVDITVFEDTVAQAQRLRQSGELYRAADMFQRALDTWEGAPLGGIPGPFAESERARLTERQMAALESRLELDVRLGRHHDVVAELTALCNEHPLREHLRALLMLALYRCGRQAEALAVYQDARHALVTQLGVEPGQELSRLQSRLLAADPLLSPSGGDPVTVPETADADRHSLPGEHSVQPSDEDSAVQKSIAQPLARELVRPRQLPADLPAFVGRSDELARIHELVPADTEPSVIATITGMAGVGKTALAVHIAHSLSRRFPEGQLYINMRGFDPAGPGVEPMAALRAFLYALGLSSEQIPRDFDAQVALYRSVLTHRRLLIVLDNVRDSEHAKSLLPGSSGCMVIITSRERLSGLVTAHGAHPIALDVMSEQDARLFLTERVGAARMDEEPDAVRRIVQVCSGLPLALAIVAARAATHSSFPLSTIADELSDAQGSLDAFSNVDATIDARAVFSWSYNVLRAPTARFFRWLALHPGPNITLPAAASLSGQSVREVRSLLAELTHAHLISEHRPRRYTFHDLIRNYAMELLDELDDREEQMEVERRLIDHYLHTAYNATVILSPSHAKLELEEPARLCEPQRFDEYTDAYSWVESERAALVSLVERAASGFEKQSWQLASTLVEMMQRRGCLVELLKVQQTGLAAAVRVADPVGVAQSHWNLGRIYSQLNRQQEGRNHLDRALTAFSELDDRAGQAATHSTLAFVSVCAGDQELAAEHARRSLDFYRWAGDRSGQAKASNNLGWLCTLTGDYEQALKHCQHAFSLFEELRDGTSQVSAWDSIGFIYHHLGDYERAMNSYLGALQLARSLRDRANEADILLHLGQTHRARGDFEAARSAWEEASVAYQDLGHGDVESVREALREIEQESHV